MSRIIDSSNTQSKRKWVVLSVISLALFMILLDVTIVNIALPSIMKDLAVSLADIEWIVNLYILIFAVLLLPAGKLGDIFGRRKIFIIGIILFTLASLVCSFAPNLVCLLVGRAVQAIGASAMMPATLSIINVEFSKKQRGLAMGIWGAVAGAANALGPILGGILVDGFSWRLIFLINVPIGVLAFIGTRMFIRESVDPGVNRAFDIPGLLAVSVSLFCLTYALIEGQSLGWNSAEIIGLFIASAVAMAVFIIVELKRKYPLAELRLFKLRSYAAGNIIGVVVNFGLIAVIFLLVLYLQIVLGYSALKAGLTLLPLPLAIIFVAPFAGKFTDIIGGRWILFAGTLISALGIFLMSDLTGVSEWTHLLLPLIVTGIGIGLVMAPVTTVVMADTPVEQSGMGAGILTTTRQIGSVMGISVLGAVLQSQLVINFTSTLSSLETIPQSVKDQIMQSISSGNLSMNMSGSSSLPAAVQAQLAQLFKSQFALSLETTMQVSIIVLLIGTVTSLFIGSHIKKKSKGK